MATSELLFIDGNGNLVVTDGTTTTQVTNASSSPPFQPDPIYSNTSAVVVGTTVYFTMADSTNATAAIWSYNGSAVTQITSSSNYVFNQPDSNNLVAPQPLGTYNGDLVFSQATIASNADHNFDTATLAIYNGSSIIQPSSPNGGYDPHDFVTLNGILYFEATDSTTNAEAIYSYDGTTVTEQYNSTANTTAPTGPLAVYNGNLYYGSGSSSLNELTPSGSSLGAISTTIVSEDTNNPNLSATNLIVANNQLYFLSPTAGVFSINTSNTVSQVFGSIGAQGFTPVVYNNELYFVSDAALGSGLVPNLYTATGGAITEIAADFSGQNFIVSGGTLYYDNNSGTTLGTINGTTVGTLSVPSGTGAARLLAAIPFAATSWGTQTISPPSVTAGATVSFTGGGSNVALDSGLVVSDASTPTLSFATIAIASGFVAGDTLVFTNNGAYGNITGSYNASTGVLTLTSSGASATVPQWQAALDSVTYSFSPSNGDPTNGGGGTSRSISWMVNDGTNSSNVATSTLNIVHAPPTVSAGATATFIGGGPAATLDGALTVSDPDSGGNLTGATVKIVGGFLAGDVLNFVGQNGIVGVYNVGLGTLTLSGPASIAAYQAALDSITYSFSPSNGDPTNGGGDTSRSISWSVSDGISNSTAATSTLNIVHAAPTVSAGATATFPSGGAAATLDGALTVSDPDSGGNLTGALVVIASSTLGDVLNFVNQNGITGSYEPGSGILALSGTASIAAYQAALRSITYSFSPSNGDPTNGGADPSRIILWQVVDGVAGSNIATSTLDAVIPPPVITTAPELTNNATPVISGSGVAGGTITLFDGTTVVGTTTADAAGNFTTALSGDLVPGPNAITATDTVGGLTSAASAQVGMFDVQAPANGISTTDFSSVQLGAVLAQGYQPSFIGGTEAITLVDGTLSVGPDTQEATVQRLYEGLLGRSGEASGLAAQNQGLNAGTSKEQVADAFLSSPEYTDAHGTMTNAQFVDSLYQGFLGRAPDPSGGASFTAVLDSGSLTRAQAVIDIADSPEAKAHLAGATSFVWVPSPTGAEVNALYQTALGRNVDVGADATLQTGLNAGMPFSQVVQMVVTSPEYQADHFGQTNTQLVASLYENGLGRAPDAAGGQAWVNFLNAGGSQAQLVMGIATSPEASAHLTQNLALLPT